MNKCAPSGTASVALTGDLDDRLAGQRLELLAQPRRHRPVGCGTCPAPQFEAHQRSARTASAAHQLRSASCATAASHASHRASSPHVAQANRSRPALPVEHAHDPRVGSNEAGQLVGQQRRARWFLASVDDMQHRPARALLVARQRHQLAPAQSFERGRGRHERAAPPRRGGPARSRRRARARSGPIPAATPRRARRSSTTERS